MKFTFVLAALVAATPTASVQAAGVTQIMTQAAFSAAGSIVQNKNFDDSGLGATFPGSPVTYGALTFGQFREIMVIGGRDEYNNFPRSLITDLYSNSFTVRIEGFYDLLAFNMGAFQFSTTASIYVNTNIGIDVFTVPTGIYGPNGTLTFVGLKANPGVYIKSVKLLGARYLNLGLTDVQIGAAGVVPEPASWALMLVGFSLVGAKLRRRTAIVA